MEQLKSWLADGNQKLDVVLISGDIANAPMDWSLSEEQQDQYQKDLHGIVDGFTSVNSKVYFIPGNVSFFCKHLSHLVVPCSLQHDVLPVFKASEVSPTLIPSQPSFPCNMHLKRTTIAPSLHLLGLGGSVPGYQGGEMIWEGFPYTNYSEMDADVHKLLDPVFFEDTSCLSANDAVILMTHVGPAESGMCILHSIYIMSIYQYIVWLFLWCIYIYMAVRHLICSGGSTEPDSVWKQGTDEASLHRKDGERL